MLLYLASESPRRREILKKMHVPFRVVKSRYREEHDARLSPAALVLLHAEGKARQAVLPKPARFVLGADTLVYCSGQVLGKPKTEKQAARMLLLLSGKGHSVYTGMALLDRKLAKIKKAVIKTRVFVKKLSKKEIRVYILKVDSMDKAGGYAIQMRPKIVTRIIGSYSNVMGLPEEAVARLLRPINMPS